MTRQSGSFCTFLHTACLTLSDCSPPAMQMTPIRYGVGASRMERCDVGRAGMRECCQLRGLRRDSTLSNRIERRLKREILA